jgi:hypothetical protein
MPLDRLLRTTTCLVTALMTAACAGGSPSAPSLTTPSAPAAAAMAPLKVQVDSVCAGRESNITVFVDAERIGVTNPGEPGVSRMVTVGSHQLSAVSERGTMWGPFPTTVGAAGQLERLGCTSFDAL